MCVCVSVCVAGVCDRVGHMLSDVFFIHAPKKPEP